MTGPHGFDFWRGGGLLRGMKITRDTPDHLILDDTPWMTGLMLAVMLIGIIGAGLSMMAVTFWGGLFFALIGGGLVATAFAVFVRRNQLILDGPAQTLTLRRQSVTRYSSVTHPLSDLSHAEIEASNGAIGAPSSTAATTRIVLILSQGMSAGRHPVTDIYTSGPGNPAGAAAINRWLAARVDSAHAAP